FLSLVLGKFVGSQITQIAPILDDIMLRIHTVLIISSYSMITLAFGVAMSYLVVAARGANPEVARITLGVVSGIGLCAWMAVRGDFHSLVELSDSFIVVIPVVFAMAGAIVFMGVPQLLRRRGVGALAFDLPPGAAGIVSTAAVAAPPRDRTALL